METRRSVIIAAQETHHLSTENEPNPANGNTAPFDSADESSHSEDVDFNWDEYLEESGSSAAPHTSFKHVETSLQSSFQPGMKLEVGNKHNSDTYWVATIITTCGQLLLLRYCGYEDDRRADFWCDVMTADLHPVGWCTQNNKALMPPDAIQEKYTDWTEFLIHDLTGSRTAPANLLEGDSQNPFQYWIVSVLENVGGRLRLRFVGLEETESYDQWLFYLDYRLRPVGWCQENKYRLDPPAEIYPLKTMSEWQAALDKAVIEAAKFPLPMEVFKWLLIDFAMYGCESWTIRKAERQRIEAFEWWCWRRLLRVPWTARRSNWSVLEEINPDCSLEGQILKVKLKYFGHLMRRKDSLEKSLMLGTIEGKRRRGRQRVSLVSHDLPFLVLSLPRIEFPAFHAVKTVNFLMLSLLAREFWLPADHADLRNHLLTVGMKLEVVDTGDTCRICPATVSKVFNNHFVQVTIDDLRPEASPASMLCHADSLGIMPVQWSLKNGVHLSPPKGYSGQDFDWADYQKRCGAEAAPQFCFRNVSFSRGFMKNMKLEAVNPKNPAEICVASISTVKGRLMWLHFEGLQAPGPDYIVDVESMDIFPVGWCEANGYELLAPPKAVLRRKRRIAVVQPEKQLPSGVPVEKMLPEPCVIPQTDTVGTINGRYSCPALFINHRCFSGPHLNKGRLAELPQSVGPGKCVLVLKEVLSLVINSAYKPGSVLRELQLVEDPRWNFQEETLKAKYRGKTYRATVKIVRTSDQVLDFCRRVCAKLECCPNLFSPVPVTEACPENCSVHTKTKYTYYYGKRRKVMKPSPGENSSRSLQSRASQPARCKKRRKPILVQKKRRSSLMDRGPAGSAEVMVRSPTVAPGGSQMQ
ncbi:Scm-like with four MBT domains protein 2 [Varanus komodoensis]|nr:Scm-like with four MBT domains protein 2 [Varanus komodoensis]